ncbi:hypothetical protein RIF29_14812 [Crotalaria pallida]|uniref:Uncharacterized protein n=1 Tax=Crotalaria pallida TaxID=3830 RepID=A0AAN9FCE0_CROPI
MARKRGKRAQPSPSPSTPSPSHDPKTLENSGSKSVTGTCDKSQKHTAMDGARANAHEISAGGGDRTTLVQQSHQSGAGMEGTCAKVQNQTRENLQHQPHVVRAEQGTSRVTQQDQNDARAGTSRITQQHQPCDGAPIGHKNLHDRGVLINPINFDLLDEQETEFDDLVESIDALDEKQASSVLEKLDRIREKINGKRQAKNVHGKHESVVKEIANPTTKEKIAKRASVKEGSIPAERVADSEYHPIVADVRAKEQDSQDNATKEDDQANQDKGNKEDDWQPVTTRSSKRLQKKMDEANQVLGDGGKSTSTSGNG